MLRNILRLGIKDTAHGFFNKTIDITKDGLKKYVIKLTYEKRTVGNLPQLNYFQYPSHQLNHPLPQKLGRQLDTRGELFARRRFFSGTANSEEIEKTQDIKKLDECVDIIRKKCIPKLQQSGNLSIYAEHIAVYLEYLIHHKKGLPTSNIPDSVSLLKMLWNTQNAFESDVLSYPSQTQAIEEIRRAIRFFHCDKELSKIEEMNYKEIRM